MDALRSYSQESQSSTQLMQNNQFTTLTLTALRIVAGFLFMPHGAQKILGWFGGYGGTGGTAAFPAQGWWAGMLEMCGGLLILIGLFTRHVAFVLSGMMAVAYFQAHAPDGFWPLLNRGELAVLYCFLFLFFCAVGAGPYSVDRLWRKAR